MSGATVVSIRGRDFWIGDGPTYPGRSWRGRRIEGLLLNSRMVQATFDDLNPQTRKRWDRPGEPWDAQRNTERFVEAMPTWRAHGLVAITLNLQGGNPQGYGEDQPWHNSAFREDGALREDYLGRLARVLDRADELGMVVILGLFYFGQDQRLRDKSAVIAGTDAAVDWLIRRGDRHVVIEVNNEADYPQYDHPILRTDRCHELIERIKGRSRGRLDTPAGRLLVSTSMRGDGIPPAAVVAAGDFVLLHGNSVSGPDRIRAMADQVRSIDGYADQPIVFNEDDHYAFDAPDNYFLAALDRGAGWGFFDYRGKGEPFEDGFQSVPTDWTISSERKRGFFNLLAQITGSDPAAR